MDNNASINVKKVILKKMFLKTAIYGLLLMVLRLDTDPESDPEPEP